MSDTIEQMESELRTLEGEARYIAGRIRPIEEKLRKAKSTRFIAANQITKDQVADSRDKDLPYHNTVYDYAAYLKSQGDPRPWFSWNGILCRTSDLLLGKFIQTDGRMEDVK